MDWLFKNELAMMTLAAIFGPLVAPLIVLGIMSLFVKPVPSTRMKARIVEPAGVVEMRINCYGLLGWGRMVELKMEDGSKMVVPSSMVMIQIEKDDGK